MTNGGITRPKDHLMGKKGNVLPCTKCPPKVKEEIMKYTKKKRTQKNIGVHMATIRNFNFGSIQYDSSKDGLDDELISPIRMGAKK